MEEFPKSNDENNNVDGAVDGASDSSSWSGAAGELQEFELDADIGDDMSGACEEGG